MPAFELLLPLGALAFYAYDCCMLLYDNELLLLRARRRWRVEAGGSQILFGRRLCLPGFAQPWLACYRLHWNDAQPSADAVPGVIGITGLLPLQVLCTLMSCLLLPVLPLVSLGYGAGWAMLGVFACYYGLILLALTLVWVRRRQWQLSGRAFAAVALDSLACAPFAVNMLRRITLQQRYTADAVATARALCEPPVRQALLATLCARLAERIAAAGDDDTVAAQLRQRCRQLEAELA